MPVWVQVTDFDLHRMWIIPDMTGYFAASDEIAFRLRAAGIAPDAAHVTGIPIVPAFLASRDRAACAAGFGLDPHRATFLLMGGGAGIGALADVAERLLALPGDFQLVVLAGRNVETLAALNTLAERHGDRLFPHGFTREVANLMTCADLAITKPGGLTTSECLAMRLPMIVYSPIPGQEERNADYLTERGAALKAHDVLALEFRVGQLQHSPMLLAQMRERARALGRPRAAEHVLQIALAQSAIVSWARRRLRESFRSAGAWRSHWPSC
jgi:processive 1,2-diacylglycerol beta-glucosyltransferase